LKKNFYVVGNPVERSLSPVIFKYWFKKYKLKHTYRKIKIRKKTFENDFIKLSMSPNFAGANITIPFKERALKTIKHKSKHAKEIKAVNCIYKKRNKLYGTNTDWYGFKKALRYQNKNLKYKNCNIGILGYGGAAKALVYCFKKTKYKKITIFVRKNPNNYKTEKDKKIYFEKIKGFNKKSKDINLLINTTATSSPKKLNISFSKLNKKCVVFDINYKKNNTSFIKEALKLNFRVNYGIYMLIFQAVPTFRHWFGFVPKVDKGLIDRCTKIK
tara:strand:+ start:227 stop:1042 length:816 start_codon:yes stop_codon:yes gene_type:complete